MTGAAFVKMADVTNDVIENIASDLLRSDEDKYVQ